MPSFLQICSQWPEIFHHFLIFPYMYIHRFFTLQETTGGVVAKFCIRTPGSLGTKNYSNGLGHMTNMTTTHICVKKLKKSSPEPII